MTPADVVGVLRSESAEIERGLLEVEATPEQRRRLLFLLDRHCEIEDELLIPELRRRGFDHGTANSTVEDHLRLRRIVRSARGSSPADWHAVLESADFVAGHLADDEAEILEPACRMLLRAERTAIWERADQLTARLAIAGHRRAPAAARRRAR